MKKSILKVILPLTLTGCLCSCMLTSCSDNEKAPYLLKQEDIQVNKPEGGFKAQVDKLFRITVNSVNDDGLIYQWILDDEVISNSKNLEYMFEHIGNYTLTLKVNQGEICYTYEFIIETTLDSQLDPTPEDATPYITKVLDFMPAVGQFTNTLPEYKEGDTQDDMNAKVLDAIGNNKKGMISLGGFGGYVVVGFDHTIENKTGLRDFRVLGNAFYAAANPNPDAPIGGSCEPGIIMVAYDQNKNGKPDDNEWYEIAGSAYDDPSGEAWYNMAVKAGNDVHTYKNYEITYYRPTEEPTTQEGKEQYIRWEDNQGNSGYKVKNNFHTQPYFPQWFKGDKLTFKGTCLPQNGIDESGKGNYYVLYKFRYGYVDNETNAKDDSAIDIDWAVNSKGQKVHLPGVDFIKIYTGVNQENGWLGECSTEVMGVEDLHLLGKQIESNLSNE